MDTCIYGCYVPEVYSHNLHHNSYHRFPTMSNFCTETCCKLCFGVIWNIGRRQQKTHTCRSVSQSHTSFSYNTNLWLYKLYRLYKQFKSYTEPLNIIFTSIYSFFMILSAFEAKWGCTMCSSRKYPYSPHRRDWKFLGVGVFSKTENFKEMYGIELEFQEGWGVLLKTPSVGEVWIFYGTTQCASQRGRGGMRGMQGRRARHAKHEQNLRGIILLPFEYFEGPRYKLPTTTLTCNVFWNNGTKSPILEGYSFSWTCHKSTLRSVEVAAINDRPKISSNDSGRKLKRASTFY